MRSRSLCRNDRAGQALQCLRLSATLGPLLHPRRKKLLATSLPPPIAAPTQATRPRHGERSVAIQRTKAADTAAGRASNYIPPPLEERFSRAETERHIEGRASRGTHCSSQAGAVTRAIQEAARRVQGEEARGLEGPEKAFFQGQTTGEVARQTTRWVTRSKTR